MPTKVNSLRTKSITVETDALNEYLYSTNTQTLQDTKIPLSNLLTSISSTGNGSSLVSAQTSLTNIVIKTLGTSSPTILGMSGTSEKITFSIFESGIDLSKCKNTTTPFLSSVNLATNVGATVLPTANGGTNRSSAWVIGDLAYAATTDRLDSIAAVATGNALISGGTGTVPSWGKIPLTTHISGTLPVGNGGSGATSFTSKGLLIGNNTGAVTTTNAGTTNGQIIIGSASGSPAFASLTSSDATVTFTTGSNTLALATKITTLQNASGTAGLVCDGSGNLISQANATLTYKRPVVNVTSGTYTPTAAQSGSIFTLNLAGGITITLPAAAAGLTYEFHVGTTFTGTFQIDAAGSGADTLQGLITMGPSLTGTATNAGVTTMIAGPAALDHQYIADLDTKGRMLGTRLKYTAITDAIWLVEGTAVTAGTCVTPFS
jgi:hypothetical protein